MGGINYSLTHDQTGYRVLGAYSGKAGRHVLPGETVHVCDEFGYWQQREPETFIGRLERGDYMTQSSDGQLHQYNWHIVRDVIPAS